LNDATPAVAATCDTADTSPAIETDDRPAHALDSPCHPAHTRTSRTKRPRPLTGDRLAEVIRRYESGETLKKIATDLGVSRTFLSGQLAKAGVQTRQHPMRDDEIRLASHLYRQGNSLASIATRLGYAKATVSRTLRDAGVAIRDSHGRER